MSDDRSIEAEIDMASSSRNPSTLELGSRIFLYGLQARQYLTKDEIRANIFWQNSWPDHVERILYKQCYEKANEKTWIIGKIKP